MHTRTHAHTHQNRSPHSIVYVRIDSSPNVKLKHKTKHQIRTDLLRKSNQITHKGILTSLFLQSTNPLHVIGTCIAFWCVNILHHRRYCWLSNFER